MIRAIFSAIVAACAVDLIHTTSGPGHIFDRMFIKVDSKRSANGMWSFVADVVQCPRCLSVYVGAAVYALSHIKILYYPFSVAMLSSKLVQYIWTEPERGDE